MTYPKYQYSIFLKGTKDEQLVIRADDWDEFLELKKKADVIINKAITATPYQAAPVKDVNEGTKCQKCGAKRVLNPNTGKWFCEKKCWLEEAK